MNRIKSAFASKKERLLNIYLTAGFPTINDTLPLMQALQQAGADIIELGMPYSDPLADGPTIQESSAIALQNGITIEKLFQQLEPMRQTIQVPVILMGYLNPVLQFGFENFCRRAAAVGVDGFILPDLPVYEFETEYRDILQRYGLSLIFLVTPETSPERIQQLDAQSQGFLYAVSSSSTTGKAKDFNEVAEYLKRLSSMQLKNPVLAGFGISDRQSFDTVCQYAHGGIIGTAFIKHLQKSQHPQADAVQFVQAILGK